MRKTKKLQEEQAAAEQSLKVPPDLCPQQSDDRNQCRDALCFLISNCWAWYQVAAGLSQGFLCMTPYKAELRKQTTAFCVCSI